ncbi:rCG38982 [Rattus norvegicus]|uniref:RCG38982 n=1 Tax=Rattus norvegicus TaxID=10116 RepID=A6KQ88_RAT|nr:rCG38982 [Rattus norvegicus]
MVPQFPKAMPTFMDQLFKNMILLAFRQPEVYKPVIIQKTTKLLFCLIIQETQGKGNCGSFFFRLNFYPI